MATARISASDLTAFWRWYHEPEGATEDEFIHSLLERSESQPQADGKHVHAILENPPVHRVEIQQGTDVNTYYGTEELGLITPDDLEIMLFTVQGTATLERASELAELEALATYEVGDDTIVVSCRVDHCRGAIVTDTKTVWTAYSDYMRGRKHDHYASSPQALFYADALNADVVRFVLFWMEKQTPLLRLAERQTVTVHTENREAVKQQCRRIAALFWSLCNAHSELKAYYTNRFLKNPETEII